MTASVSLTHRVRAAIARLPEPFSAKDVMAALRLTAARDYDNVSSALRGIEALGELESELVGKRPAIGEGRPKHKVFRTTRTFRPEVGDPLAQLEAGRFINQVICSWTARRHAAAE